MSLTMCEYSMLLSISLSIYIGGTCAEQAAN